ncbi:hypothetical protein AB4175_23220 [Vibrio cyclitrophicus]
MLDTLIIIISTITTILGLGVAIWSYMDTHKKYSHKEHLNDIEKKRKEAEERFKEKTRLDKK